MKVFATFVTYHPDKSLFDRAVRSVEAQVDKVLVIDNTEHNEGIAKALNKAFAMAAEEGCDYLLTMDQDSVATPGMVSRLVAAVQQGGKVGQCGPAYDRALADGKVHEVDHVITSGALTSVQAWKDACGFVDDLFIDMVDVEFSYHIAKLGYKVLLAGDVLMEHHLGEGLTGIECCGKLHFGFIDHVPVRWYYMTRNTLVIKKKYSDDFPEQTALAIKRLRKSVFRMLIAGRGRCQRLRMVLKGAIDSRKFKF